MPFTVIKLDLITRREETKVDFSTLGIGIDHDVGGMRPNECLSGKCMQIRCCQPVDAILFTVLSVVHTVHARTQDDIT